MLQSLSIAVGVIVLALSLGPAGIAQAGCNLFPGTTLAFNSTLGTTNRPFAAPGEPLEIARRSCDVAAQPFLPDPADHVVTVVFAPPSGGIRNVVVLARDCAGIATCPGAPTTCIDGSALTGLALVPRADGIHLSFRFPDTDALVDGPTDGRTLAGPATIAVTRAGALLPCGLVTAGCAAQAGPLVACIDDFFVDDGNCGTLPANREATFRHFTALPRPNDFADACFRDGPPCTPAVSGPGAELRATIDAVGNLLVPVDWQRVLVNDRGVPVPRTLRATVDPPAAITRPPSPSYLASYTPEGGLLPPIFVPQSDPSAPGAVLTLFGTSDAPYTILRLARRTDTCAGGVKLGIACVADTDCPASTCRRTCAGGPNDGAACTRDSQCGSARCGQLFDLSGNAPRGLLVLQRFGPGFCQGDFSRSCTSNAVCGGDAPCVLYALEAQTPVPLDGLVQTDATFTFVVNEAVAGAQLNGDSDFADSVVTLRNRQTGVVQPIGNDPVCGIGGDPPGRAVNRIMPTAASPAVAAEGDLAAFLESEPGQDTCDANRDGDVSDSILRMFRLGSGEIRGDRNLAVDAAPLVNGQSLAISSGTVFVRTPERAGGHENLTRVNLVAGGTQPTGPSSISFNGNTISEDGRFVVFMSDTDLDPADTNLVRDVYLHDRQTGTNTFIPGVGLNPVISGDGRYVAFGSNRFEPVGTPEQLYVWDRLAPGNPPQLVSQAGFTGVPGDGDSDAPSISADGRYLAFQTLATNLGVPGNGASQIVFRDRIAGTNALASQAFSITGVPTGVAGDGGSFQAVISGDGRMVAFHTVATNLGVPLYGSSANHVIFCSTAPFLCLMGDVSPGGSAGNSIGQSARLSSNGRFLAFESLATNLVPCGGTCGSEVYVRDLEAYPIFAPQPERVSTKDDGTAGSGSSGLGSLSADGRYVAFYSNAALVPGPTSGSLEVHVRDRVTATTRRLTFNTGGGDGRSYLPAISGDGRTVAFVSASGSLPIPAPADTNSCSGACPFCNPSCPDIFVQAIAPGASCGNGTVDPGEECDPPNTTAAACPALYGASDARCGPTCQCNDFTQDGALGATVLQAVDGVTGDVATLCPADDVVASGGAAVFLRPESAGNAPGCPPGPDLNGNGLPTERVVHYWSGAGAVENLSRAAVGVTMGAVCSSNAAGCGTPGDCPPADTCAPPWIAALVSEAGQGGGSLNDADSDTLDDVVEVHRVGDAPTAWRNLGVSATTVRTRSDDLFNPASLPRPRTVTDRQAFPPRMAGSLLAFLTSERDEGSTDLNGNTPGVDNVLRVYDADGAGFGPGGRLLDTALEAEEFVLGEPSIVPCGSNPAAHLQMVAFRVSEAAQNQILNGALPGGDGDLTDAVMHVVLWDLTTHTGTVVSTRQAATPCTFEKCDARRPYRVTGSKVKFLTIENEQGVDLDGDGSVTPGKYVLQTFDACTGVVVRGASVDPGTSDPFLPPDSDSDVTVTQAGRCIDDVTQALLASPGACRPDVVPSDCPPGATCQPAPVVVATSPTQDADHDGIPDGQDNCPTTPNPGQSDRDGDGVGDACDGATCGDGVVDPGEACDGASDAACPGACGSNCTCPGCAPVVDPKANVTVVTKNNGGKLSVSMVVPFDGYAGQQVVVQLADTDIDPIARAGVATLAPKGRAGTTFAYKARTKAGVKKVQLGPSKTPGASKLVVKAAGWFPATAANQPAASTQVTIQIGQRCFTHAATKKID